VVKHRVGQKAQAVELDQDGGVTHPGDFHRGIAAVLLRRLIARSG
jgi:hypothetical protein